MTIKRAKRFDFANVRGKVKVTPQGFVRIPAHLTRVGVLKYTRADGTQVSELRPAGEVFREDSLDSLRGAPVTEGHQGMINPDNVASFGVGVASEQISHDDKYVKGELTVQRQDTITRVKSKELCEISPGYTCTIEPTPGKHKGERYDQIQRNIVYNHIALGPKGWGRSGAGVGLHLDSDEDDVAYSRLDEAADNIENKKIEPPKGIDMKKITIRIDGIAYEIEVVEPLAANLEAAIAKLQTERQDALDNVSRVEGELTAEKKQCSDLQEKYDTATDPKALDAVVTERVTLVENAKKLHAEIKCDGKTAHDIKVEALENVGHGRETFDGKDAHFVDGVFHAAVGAAKTQTAAEDTGVGPVLKRTDSQTDADEKKRTDSVGARERMLERNREAWKQPIGKGAQS